ncbi:MAG: adenylosuccinate synthase [Puniceicoccaceae bacterium]|nr:MAG: adenylosuccinate synthase [Puniceicoccaceae bacterium]
MALKPFRSNLIADVGVSTGDEGKGRLIPEVIDELRAATGLEAPVGVVLKVNGGANSGHTAGGLKLNLLPAGVVAESVPCLALGAGVVADPRKIWWETRPLEARGHVIRDRLLVDERTMVSDLCHRLLDLAWEHYREHVLGEPARGSTGRGITPAYLDEVGQFPIFFAEFRGDARSFRDRLAARADRALRTIEHVCRVDAATFAGFFDRLTEAEVRANRPAIEAGIFTEAEFDFGRFRSGSGFALEVEAMAETWWTAGSALAGRIGDVRERVLGALRAERSVIGEFGQAYWLDKRHGFSPNVTASHTYTPELFQSAGIPVQPVHTFGVAKAYDTKVGTHTFLTQIPDGDPMGERLKRLEFGTSTGRQRMVGWFDAVEKADTLRYGGFDDLMINKIDALGADGGAVPSLKIGYAYEDEAGRRIQRVPRDEAVRRRLRPVYRLYPSWREDLGSVRRFADLPEAARAYTAGMMRAVIEAAWPEGAPLDPLPNLRYLGVGPDREQVIRDLPPTDELLRLDRGGVEELTV